VLLIYRITRNELAFIASMEFEVLEVFTDYVLIEFHRSIVAGGVYYFQSVNRIEM